MMYIRITDTADSDIPALNQIHLLPEVSKFISISENYWNYVTSCKNVSYYKIYSENTLVGAVHTELNGNTLYLSILVFPEHQNKGYGTAVIRDIKNGVLPYAFNKIEVSIDKTNTASIRLFEKCGFVCVSQEGELLNLVFAEVKGNGTMTKKLLTI